MLAARGYSDEAIAAQLGTTISTAETHRRDAQAKLCCAGHHELLLHAIRHGIVTAAEVDLYPLNRKATRRHSRESITA